MKKSSGKIRKIFLNDDFGLNPEFEIKSEEQMEEDNKDDDAKTFIQWDIARKNAFYPMSKKNFIESIPTGYYKIFYDQNNSSYYVGKREIKTDELINLPIDKGNDIIEDIKKFWAMKDRYKEYELLHKRGLLMYGPPGSGKTCVINQILKQLIENYKGLIFSIESSADLEAFHDFSGILRQIEPERPLVVIIEDIDGLLDGGRSIEKLLLNILDGVNQIDNVAYIATTNYPERMEARLINRPGRFDRRFKIGYPIAKVRKAFFEAKMHEEDKKLYDIKEMVQKTSKLTIAHCKEVFTEHVIKGRSLDEVVKEMKMMSTEQLHSSDDLGKKKVGFGGEDGDFWDDLFEDINWDEAFDGMRKVRDARK